MTKRTSEELEHIENMKQAILSADKIAVLTGAGISTESGVPDFASLPDYYDADEDMTYSRQEVMSKWFFYQKPAAFYAYMKKHLHKADVEPNEGHYFLAELEKRHDVTIVTQNIDGLHEKAGSSKVIPYHGSLEKSYCLDCNRTAVFPDAFQNEKGHYCHLADDESVHFLIPDVVLYGQPIAPANDLAAIKAFREADLILVMGTSLEVFPAADLISNNICPFTVKVLVNKTPGKSELFHHVFEMSIGDFVETLPFDESGRVIVGSIAVHRAKIAAARYQRGDVIKRSDFSYEDELFEGPAFEQFEIRDVSVNEDEEGQPVRYCLSNKIPEGMHNYSVCYFFLEEEDFIN